MREQRQAEHYLSRLQRRATSIKLLFWLIVAIPTAASILYFGAIASKRYSSEAIYIVRGVSSHRSSGLDAIFRTFGISRTVDDTFAIQNFILSRDALRLLEERLPLRDIFSRPEADLFARFPHFWRGDSFEMLYEYYLQNVTAVQDPTKGITTLTVVTFRPEDSHLIATTLLRLAEEMVNRMNDRAQRDTIRESEAEVKLAEQKVVAAQDDLTQFRNRELLVDPARTSVSMLDTIGKLSTDLAQTSAQISQTRSTSPASPTIQSMLARANALQQRIGLERAKMAGSNDALASKVATYERLSLLRSLADKSLATSLTGLETARQEARRQQIYIEEIVSPNKPDEDNEPRRFRLILTVFVTSFAVFAMFWILSAGAKEHAQ